MTLFRTKYLNLLILFGLISEITAWATLTNEKTCRSVDLRKKYDFLKFASDQGKGAETCYAFAAADLVSAKLGRPVSAIDIHTAFQNSLTGKAFSLLSISGGLPNSAIDSAQSRGFCPEDQVRSSNNVLISLLSNTKSNFGKTLSELKELSTILAELPPKSRRNFAQCKASQIEGFNYFFPKMSINALVDILSQSPAEEILDRLIDFNCDKKRIQADFKIVSHWGFGDTFSEMASYLTDAELDQENAVALGFRGNILKNIYVSTGEHASTIIGRRWDKERKQCEYLLKNTWGIECKNKGRHLYDPFFLIKNRCENGNIWIPGELLFPRTHMVIYLK